MLFKKAPSMRAQQKLWKQAMYRLILDQEPEPVLEPDPEPIPVLSILCESCGQYLSVDTSTIPLRGLVLEILEVITMM